MSYLLKAMIAFFLFASSSQAEVVVHYNTGSFVYQVHTWNTNNFWSRAFLRIDRSARDQGEWTTNRPQGPYFGFYQSVFLDDGEDAYGLSALTCGELSGFEATGETIFVENPNVSGGNIIEMEPLIFAQVGDSVDASTSFSSGLYSPGSWSSLVYYYFYQTGRTYFAGPEDSYIVKVRTQIAGQWHYGFIEFYNEQPLRWGYEDVAGELLVIPAFCHAELTNDNELNFFDISEFVQLYLNGNSFADIDNDGDLDFSDISEYLTHFNNGCE